MKKIIQIITLVFTISIGVSADCNYGDKTYPEGAIRGPYICISGTWIRR